MKPTLLLALLLAPALHATPATVSWDGGGANSNWTTKENWFGDVAPSSGDNIVFYDSATNLATTLSAPQVVNKLTFNSSATNSITIAGSITNNFELGAGGLSVAAGNHVFTGTGTSSSGTSYDWRFGTSSTLDVATGASFEIGGRIRHATGSQTQTKTGGGTLILSGDNGNSGAWSTTFEAQEGIVRWSGSNSSGNSGNGWTVSNSAAIEVQGNTTINNGTLTLEGSGPDGAGALRTLNGTRTISGTSSDITKGIVLNGDTTIGVEAGATLSLQPNISGAKKLSKVGEGTLNLSGTNSQSGLTIQKGVVSVSGSQALPSGVILGTGSSVNDSSELNLAAAGSYTAGSISIGGILKVTGPVTGSATLSITDGGGLLSTASRALEIGANVTVAMEDAFDVVSSTASGDRSIELRGTGTVIFNGIVRDNASGSAAAFTGGVRQVGTGLVILNAANTYTGSTSISAGTLLVNGNNSAATGTVAIGSAATLGGIGTLGGNTTINGTHNPGAPGAVGSQNFAQKLTYNANSIFEWDLNENSTSSGFDTTSAAGNIDVSTTGTVFRVVFGNGVNLNNEFWSNAHASQTWALSDIFGKAFHNGYFASVDSTADPMTQGFFTIDGSNLTWSAVPEPTSACVAFLLAAGILRRRR